MSFTYRVDWRRGPSHMRRAFREVRVRLMEDIASEIRRNAPHPSVAASVSHSASQVVVAHEAAAIFEFGVAPGKGFPPVDRIAEWAVTVGKDRDEAFPIARAIQQRGLPEQPYIRPAIETAMDNVPGHMRVIWEGGR